MVTSVRPRGLQNDHRGRPDSVCSASPLDGTNNNHKCPVGCVGPPDSRLSSITSPCKQTSKVMAIKTPPTAAHPDSGVSHACSPRFSLCAPLLMQVPHSTSRHRKGSPGREEDRESGPQTGSPPSRPEEEQRLRLWGPEPKQPLWG